MAEFEELLNIEQASEWATKRLNKTVTTSNITYPINYGRVPKGIDNSIANILRNARKVLAEDFDVFLVANDKYNLYPHLN